MQMSTIPYSVWHTVKLQSFNCIFRFLEFLLVCLLTIILLTCVEITGESIGEMPPTPRKKGQGSDELKTLGGAMGRKASKTKSFKIVAASVERRSVVRESAHEK